MFFSHYERIPRVQLVAQTKTLVPVSLDVHVTTLHYNFPNIGMIIIPVFIHVFTH